MKAKIYEVKRYTMGISVRAGGRAFPSAHVIYEVLYSDGNYKLERGRSVVGMPEHRSNMTKAEVKASRGTSRPDLFTTIHAAAILNAHLEEACLLVDGQLIGPNGKTLKP